MVFALVSIALSAPPTGFTTAIERVPLARTGGRVEVSVDPFVKTISIKGARVAGRLESQLCPSAEPRPDGVTLRCTTRRLWAAVTDDEKNPALDLRMLRGVTHQWDEIGLPLQAWPMSGLGIHEDCPGTNEVVRAECALGAGELEEAERRFNAALTTADQNFARLRLGDLALRRGQPEAALRWYAAVSTTGPVSRIARLRECDLTGNCFSARPAPIDGLAAPIALEAVIHQIRHELAIDHELEAMRLLTGALDGALPLCTVARAFCQKVVEAAFDSGDDEATTLALAAFTRNSLSDGPDGVPVGLGAARAAEGLGAPAFAAAVLASLSNRVRPGDLEPHLLRIVELYLVARDPVRAQFVLEYAEQRLGAASLKRQGWQKARRRLEPRSPRGADKPPAPAIADRLPALTDEIAISRELARAASVRSAAAHPSPAGAP